MGQTAASLGCKCFEELGSQEDAMKDRIETMQKGALFMRTILLGLSSQKISVRLSDDTSCIQWKTEPGAWSAEHGELDLVRTIKQVKVHGHQVLLCYNLFHNECNVFNV